MGKYYGSGTRNAHMPHSAAVGMGPLPLEGGRRCQSSGDHIEWIDFLGHTLTQEGGVPKEEIAVMKQLACLEFVHP